MKQFFKSNPREIFKRSPNFSPLMRLKLPILALLLTASQVQFAAANNAYAEGINPHWVQIRVTGQVTGVNGEGLTGVTVAEKGTSNGTTTDINGNYSLSVANDATLVFSYIGYAAQEIPVAGQTVVNVKMAESSAVLDQVVVVGYGSQKKKDLTGSVAVVDSKELEDRPNNQFGFALEGKAAGVQVVRSSGQVQSGFSVRVRGISTITSGSEPLYLVDGVPTTTTGDINPADIESISVLKDASSAAIFGASGSNGVVLITTKRGKNQKTRVSFNTYRGISNITKHADVLTGQEYIDLMTELGQSVDWTQYTANKDWQKEVFRTGASQSYQLGINGGNENTGYYISGAWTKLDGAVITNTMNRANFKVNLDHTINPYIKVGTSIAYSRWHDVDLRDNWRHSIITSVITGAPVIDVYTEANTFTANPFIADVENPVALAIKNDHQWNNNRFNGNVYGEVKILEGLKFRSMLGVEQTNGEYNAWIDPNRSREGRSFSGIADLSNTANRYWISENTLNYTKSLERQNFSILGGFVASENKADFSSIHATNFGGSAVQTVNGGALRTANAGTQKRRNVSFLSRVNYGFDNKYLLTANFRADASSIFGAGKNVWGYFPSFSAGWRISQEDFFQGIDVINDMKIRAGWGEVGNDQSAYYASYGIVNPGAFYVIGNQVVPGTSPSSLENANLKWETTRQTDIGVDLALYDSRILFTTDYYIKKTTDMLLDKPIPASVGIPSNTAIANIGTMENRGIEFAISTRNFVNDFKWNTDFNISFNKSKVLDIDSTTIKVGNISDRGAVGIAQQGSPLGLFYGLTAEGVDPETGMMIYKDLDGDGTLSDGDKSVIGNANPKFIFGLTNGFKFKNFSLNVFVQGVQGNDIFNATRIETEGMSDGRSQSAAVLRRWTTPGQVTDIPRAVFGDYTNSLISTRFVEDGSYVRIKSVTLGYDVPLKSLERIKMSRLYLYVTGENLLTFTNYSGFDPEVSLYGNSAIAPGIDYGTTPQTRDIIFGLNVTF